MTMGNSVDLIGHALAEIAREERTEILAAAMIKRFGVSDMQLARLALAVESHDAVEHFLMTEHRGDTSLEEGAQAAIFQACGEQFEDQDKLVVGFIGAQGQQLCAQVFPADNRVLISTNDRDREERYICLMTVRHFFKYLNLMPNAAAFAKKDGLLDGTATPEGVDRLRWAR